MTEQIEQTLIQKLCSPLDKADIELRIGNTNAKGFSLLAYKTARTDVKRLNEVCGLNWSNNYFYDAKDILSCAIAIKHDGEWVSRVDVGTESNTEKEKGSYSDAFKRAGFKWGIGIELYQSPYIWIEWEMEQKEYNGRKKYEAKGFWGSNLDIQEYLVIDGVPYFKIAYNEKSGARIIFNNIPNSKEVVKKTTATSKKAQYEEYLGCLERVVTKELWLEVKPYKDKWVIWTKNNYGQDYSTQLNDKFNNLAAKFEPIPTSQIINNDIPDYLK